MTFYYKRSGYNEFFRVSGTVRKSIRGYNVLTITECEPVTKYRYYEHCAPCFIMIGNYKPGDEIHEIGHSYLPWPKIK